MNDNYNGAEPIKAPVARSESVGSLRGHSNSKDDLSKSKASLKASLNNLKMEDPGQVKFTKEVDGKPNDAVVEISGVEQPFAGMSKEELMHFANDPFWVRLRWFLFILFWLGWLGMLAGAIAIIVMAPKCPAPSPLEYWQKSPIYQVLPRSFEGQTENAKGDLKGVMGRLDHLANLDVKVLWMSSIFTSSSASSDAGYDTVDFTNVDPMLGSLADFEELVKAADAKSIKVVLDIVPNHSSDKHPWFAKSVNSEDPYTHYYVWRNCTSDAFPNTWTTVNGEPAWTWDETRGQCYLNQFGPGRPDFNFNNPAVIAEFQNILRFWSERKVSGFRLDTVAYLIEDSNFVEQPPSNFADNLEVVAQMRSVLDELNADGERRILMTEADVSLENWSKLFGNDTDHKLSDVPLNNQLIKTLSPSFTAAELNRTVQSVMNAAPTWAWPNWVISNPRNSRTSSRLGPDAADALSMVQMLLPGTPIIYYGDDIGMLDEGEDDKSTIAYEPAMGLMDWQSAKNQTENPSSRLSVYKSLIALRKSNSILYGDTEFPYFDDDVFSFTRIRKGSPGYLVAVNVAATTRYVNFASNARIPSEGTVEIRTAGSTTLETVPGNKLDMSNVTLASNEGLVLSFVPVNKA